MSEETNKPIEETAAVESNTQNDLPTIEVDANQMETPEASEAVVENNDAAIVAEETVVSEEAVNAEETAKPRARKERESKNQKSDDDLDDDLAQLQLIDDQPEELDWEVLETGISGVSREMRAQMEEMYAATPSVTEHQVVIGKVVALTDREAIIDIDSKSEGVVSLNEFRYNPDLKVSDEVEVLVDKL